MNIKEQYKQVDLIYEIFDLSLSTNKNEIEKMLEINRKIKELEYSILGIKNID